MDSKIHPRQRAASDPDSGPMTTAASVPKEARSDGRDATSVERPWLRWTLVILAVLPFHLPLLQHLLNGSVATGFLQYDAPYYMANARAIFEHGNGFAYPNPYDPDPHAPVIYFHWLMWLLGFGVKFLHLDPGALFATLGVAGSIICSALTLRLVELVLPDPRGRWGWFLLTLWGGGIVCVGAAALNLTHGQPLLTDLFRLDAGEGWWFPNWGRNLITSTEVVYHCLVAATWIGVLQRRWGLAIGAVGALAATHPFSGLQHLLILNAWLGITALRERTSAAWGRALLALTLLVLFGLYYFWFLNLFPTHRALIAVWSTAHQVTLTNIFVEVGPLVLVALWRLRQAHWRPDESGWFWLTAFFVTFLLMQHDWFIAPHQPAHFSRGYLWLPVWLLALPQLQAWGRKWDGARHRLVAVAAWGLLWALCVADNTSFIVRDLNGGELARVRLPDDQREMYGWMDRMNLRGVLLCFDTRLSYHAATYTGVRTYYGHLNNTPNIGRRWREVAGWHRQGITGAWLQTIDYVLIERTNPPAAFDWSQWTELHRNRDYILLGRRDASPAIAPVPGN